MQRHKLPLMERLVGIARPSASALTTPQDFPADATIMPESPQLLLPSASDKKAFQELMASLAQAVDTLRAQRAQTPAEIAQASVELGIAIAERLLETEIAADRQRLDRIVRTALERIPSNRAVVLRAHPDDVALVRQQMENSPPDRRDDLIAFQPDGAIPRGQIKLEADEVFVEWDTQRALADLRNALVEETITEA